LGRMAIRPVCLGSCRNRILKWAHY
jgi:hypothetical protein